MGHLQPRAMMLVWLIAGSLAMAEGVQDLETDRDAFDPPGCRGCERRLKSAARGGRKVQRWGWFESTPG